MKNIFWILCFAMIGCAQGSCRENAEKTKAQNPAPTIQEQKMQSGLGDRLQVYKLDGSLQCDEAKPVELDKMRLELKDIAVYKSFKDHDGLMRAQLCGTPTGRINIYEIDRTSLSQAQGLGFKQWIKE